MAVCWFEFPDTQEQADAISSLKRAMASLGHGAEVHEAPELGPGAKLVHVMGDFMSVNDLLTDARSVLYLGIVRGSKRPIVREPFSN